MFSVFSVIPFHEVAACKVTVALERAVSLSFGISNNRLEHNQVYRLNENYVTSEYLAPFVKLWLKIYFYGVLSSLLHVALSK